MTSINILFHSVTGHTFRLAEAIGEGVSSLSGCEAHLKRIPELPGLDPIGMPVKTENIIRFDHLAQAKVEDLVDCDGLALGTPVYWGNMTYATKYFLDSVVNLRQVPSPQGPVAAVQALLGKPVTVFTGGGGGLANDFAISGIWTTLSFFGMTIVTVGMRVPEVSDTSHLGGGSPLGAGSYSRSPGERPSANELAIARAQGRALAEVTRAWSQRTL